MKDQKKSKFGSFEKEYEEAEIKYLDWLSKRSDNTKEEYDEDEQRYFISLSYGERLRYFFKKRAIENAGKQFINEKDTKDLPLNRQEINSNNKSSQLVLTLKILHFKIFKLINLSLISHYLKQNIQPISDL